MLSFRFIALVLLFLSSNTQAQKVENSKFQDIWNKINYLRYHNPDSSSKLLKSAIKQAEFQNETNWKALFYIELSRFYMETNIIDSAKCYNAESKFINEQSNNDFQLSMNLLMDGFIHSNQSEFIEATDLYLQTIEKGEQTGNTLAKLYALIGLSNVYVNQRNEILALTYGREALTIAERYGDPIELANTKGTLAEALRVFEHVNESEVLFAETFNFFENTENPIGKAKTLANWSIMYENDLEKCMQMGFDAQHILDRLTPVSGYAMSNTYNLGWGFFDMYNAWPEVPTSYSNYYKKQLLDSSQTYFQKTLDIALDMKNKQWEMFAKGILGDVFFEKKEFEKAYILANDYFNLKDSIFSQSNKNKIAELENQKAILEKDGEIEIRELKIVQGEKEKWYLISGLILLTFTGGLLWYQNGIRKKRNQDLKQLNTALSEANTVKAKLFSILNHDLRSPVANLINFINLQKNNPELLDIHTKEQLENKTLVSAQNLLVSMEDLLVWCKNQMEHFEPKFNTFSVTVPFQEIQRYFRHYEHINLIFEYNEHDKITTDINYLNTILRNLTLNAISAVKNVSEPIIKWTCRILEDHICLTISDNGIGFSAALSPFSLHSIEPKSITQGLGIQIITDLVRAIKSEVILEKNGIHSGTTIHLKLPLHSN